MNLGNIQPRTTDYGLRTTDYGPRTSAFSLPPRRAFTLIEILGAVAVLAILAGLMAPAIVKRVDFATATKEASDLGAISNALTMQILVGKSVPDASTWAQAAQNYLTLPLASITTTPRRYARQLLVDPNWNLPGSSPVSGSLYLQTNNAALTNPPSNARMMIVSQLGGPQLSSGLDFNDLWNTPAGAKPATLSSWNGKAEDLLVQRLDIGPLFRHLILVNADTGYIGTFALDGATPQLVPAAPFGTNIYCLANTVVGLCDTNGTLLARELLQRDISFVFEYGIWRARLQDGIHTGQVDFAAWADQFLSADTHPRSKADQTEVVVLMYDYMFNYASWAGDPDVCFNFYGGAAKDVSQNIMMGDATKALKTVEDRLVNSKK